jgi:GH25 family lysozyme M1 (1,4-beta-N-acetylmuramidase)
MGKIIDISHHQIPSAVDYDKLAKQLDLAIVRTQYGSSTLDKYYKIHHEEFRKRGIPTNAYAWVRGINLTDMEIEATDFYNRTKEFNPEVWWLDVEEVSMPDMRSGISAYVKKLRELGARKVGAYIAHHLYSGLNLNLAEFDAVWIPRYGTNTGVQQVKPAFPCDIWQYSSVAKLDGYAGNLDVNEIISDKSLDFFTGNPTPVYNAVPVYVAPTPVVHNPIQAKPQPAPVSSSVVPYPGHVIEMRSKGKDVERIQRAVGVKVDGDFGPKTYAAVRAYQSRHGLGVDGRVGPATWSVMF